MEHDGRIVSVTRSFATMLDSEVELLFGQSIFDMLTSDDEVEPVNLLSDGRQIRVVLQNDRRSLFWSAHKIAKGAALGGYYVGLLWDEGELESLERRLVHRERLATLGGLAAGVVHEIAGPLNIIANNAELLLDEDSVTPRARQGLTTMRNEVFRLCGLLNDILDFARDSPMKVQGHDPVALVNKSLGLFKHQLCDKKISWRIEAEDGLPQVRGEVERLQQVFINLFKNAWDASPNSGEVVVIVRRQRLKQGDASIEFVIVDSGEGIAPCDLERVFDPFFTTKPAGQGTGLGLSVANLILTAHQGSLSLTSMPGEGTRATVLLPVYCHLERPIQCLD
jgi:signal transduction histidine kinase